eukprot:3643813-Pleurochrysis_carterae.AAC.1
MKGCSAMRCGKKHSCPQARVRLAPRERADQHVFYDVEAAWAHARPQRGEGRLLVAEEVRAVVDHDVERRGKRHALQLLRIRRVRVQSQ